MSFRRDAIALFLPALALPLCGGLLSSACDKDEAKPATAAPSAAITPTIPLPPQGPTKPQLAVDDTAAFVAGERVELAADAKNRVTGALAGKLVEGETLVLNASRDAKLPKIEAVFDALASQKAKAVEVHTPLRDRSSADIVFVLDAKPQGCSTVGFIAKDSAIATWPSSGATAERFTHGMAGPDLTRGSEGIRKRVLACDAPVWFAAADDNVTWGLVFDLVVAVMHPDDAGLPKARSVALLTKPPVPGRKVESE